MNTRIIQDLIDLEDFSLNSIYFLNVNNYILISKEFIASPLFQVD